MAERPTMREWLERVRQISPIRTEESGAQIIRELRDAKDLEPQINADERR